MIAEADGYFVGFPELHFRDGIYALETRWTKYIELKEKGKMCFNIWDINL